MNKAFLLLCSLLLSGIGSAEEQRAWTHPDVLKAAIDVRASAEQRPQFRAAVTEFLQGFNGDVQRLLKANNQTGLPRKITKKRKARIRTMDEQMRSLLTEDQFPAYETYRDTLLAKMEEAAKARRR